jgi:hypothetical protein
MKGDDVKGDTGWIGGRRIDGVNEDGMVWVTRRNNQRRRESF